MVSANKTAVFLMFISIGLLMKWKMPSTAEQAGIKKIVLNLALPATIFIALMGVEVNPSLLLLPFLALALNGLLFVSVGAILPILGVDADSPKHRTSKLMVSSFAPGLSCFPFLLEYRGEDALALAAMADLGNKVFVLAVLYLVAMHWHDRTYPSDSSRTGKLRSLAQSFLTEPVNVLIVLALALMSAGHSMASLPEVIAEPLRRLSAMMTPLVLLFIGLAVQLRGGQLWTLASILLVRAALVSWLAVALAAVLSPSQVLVALAFGLSACSFWPFMHISSVDSKEKDLPSEARTFDGAFAVNMLALSFPLSTFLILLVLSVGEPIAQPSALVTLAGGLTAASLVTYLSSRRLNRRSASYLKPSGVTRAET